MSRTFLGQESVSLSRFIDELSQYPPLSTEEEQRLAVIISSAPLDDEGLPVGDEARAAINHLVESNMKYALNCARKMCRRGVPLDDLVRGSIPGMIRAAEKFMPGRVRFISYARHWIRSSLQECVAKESRPVDMPVSASHGLSAVLKQMNKDYSMFGRVDMDPGHLSQQTGLSVRGVEAVICLMNFSTSMSTSRSEIEAVHSGLRRDSPLVGSEKRGDMHSTDESCPDLNSEAPDAIAYHLDNVRLCDLLLSHMNPRQRSVVRRVYLQGVPPADLARELGVTRQAVDCTLGKALKRARARAEKLQQIGII